MSKVAEDPKEPPGGREAGRVPIFFRALRSWKAKALVMPRPSFCSVLSRGVGAV